jgi:hypothetical protein
MGFYDNATIEILDVSGMSPDHTGRFDTASITTTTAPCFFERMRKSIAMGNKDLYQQIDQIDAKCFVMDVSIPDPTKAFVKLTKLNGAATSQYYKIMNYSEVPAIFTGYEMKLIEIEEPVIT